VFYLKVYALKHAKDYHYKISNEVCTSAFSSYFALTKCYFADLWTDSCCQRWFHIAIAELSLGRYWNSVFKICILKFFL
jgi:hypothetical protein